MSGPSPTAPAAGSAVQPLPWFLQSGGRLLGTLTLILILVTGAFAYAVLMQIHYALRDQAARHNAITAQLIAPLVAVHFESLTRYLESYARRAGLLAAVANHEPAGARFHLAELVKDNPQVDRAFITDTHGTLWVDYPPDPAVHGQNFADRDWFKGISGGRSTYVSGVYRRTAPPQRYLVAVAAPLRDERGTLLGYLVEQHTVQALADWLAEIEAPGEGRVALLDNHGRLVASRESVGNPPLSLAQHPLVRRALAGQSGAERLADPVTGRDSLISYSPVPPIGWVVLVRNPIEAVTAPIAALQHSFLVFALVFLLALIMLAFFWLNTIRRYNRELSEREARFRGLLESAPDAIVAVDGGGRMTLINSQTERWFGYRRDELLGESVEVLVPGVLCGGQVRHREDCLLSAHAPPTDAGVELKGCRKDGSVFPVEVSLSPLEVKDGLLTIAIIRDVSERRKQEEALRQYTLQLEAANRELESFSYSVSHDLRTPLRAIDGFSHVLLDDCGANMQPDCRDYLHRVRAASQHMAMLIDDLLKLATVTRAELIIEEVDLSRIAREVIEELRNADPGREVEVTITPNLRVNGDERLLRIALGNLLSNAWKFTGTRRTARIEFGLVEQTPRPVYRVRDNGVGFNMAYADKLFAPFQRLHDQSEFPGTGIGLATVQRILRKHGGQIWGESTPGEGTSFYFTL